MLDALESQASAKAVFVTELSSLEIRRVGTLLSTLEIEAEKLLRNTGRKSSNSNTHGGGRSRETALQSLMVGQLDVFLHGDLSSAEAGTGSVLMASKRPLKALLLEIGRQLRDAEVLRYMLYSSIIKSPMSNRIYTPSHVPLLIHLS
jgi:hypothetical protein